MDFGKDPLHLRESEDELPTDGSLNDPVIQQMLDREEDELELLLIEEGVTEEEFRKALNQNPAGFIEWVRLSSALPH